MTFPTSSAGESHSKRYRRICGGVTVFGLLKSDHKPRKIRSQAAKSGDIEAPGAPRNRNAIRLTSSACDLDSGLALLRFVSGAESVGVGSKSCESSHQDEHWGVLNMSMSTAAGVA